MTETFLGNNTTASQSNNMCGIFGSKDFKTYEKLYTHNKKRGNFSYGSLYVTKNKEIYQEKRKGVYDMTGQYAYAPKEYQWFLGHTQAPTSSQREFTPRTSHPFEDIYYIVAHNGVLENAEQIEKDILIAHMNPVDSSVIPAMLSTIIEFDEDIMQNESVDDTTKTSELMAMEKTCNTLKGTFGCWFYSKLTGCMYLARSGSTLFANIYTGDFSSIRVPGICDQELSEGVIYCITTEGLAECGHFKSNSPFFL